MNRAQRLGLGLALGVLLVLGGGGGAYLWLAGPGAVYDARGRVAGFGQDGRSLIVEHEAVEGYMEAMTMSFDVKDTTALSGLDVGDAIGFRLHTGADRSSWITDVERLPDSAVAEHPAGQSLPRYASESASASKTAALEEGSALPSVSLARDQDGAPVQLPADYDGQTLVLTFIYTSCPLPDYCPLMSQNFAALQDTIPARLQADVELLSVSFDPKNDTPPVLTDYAARYTDDLTNWTFATGTPEQVQRLTSLFGVFTQQKDGQITHNLTTALIGPDGRVRERWHGNDWQPADVLKAVKRVEGATRGG